jgi:hypothetical protein
MHQIIPFRLPPNPTLHTTDHSHLHLIPLPLAHAARQPILQQITPLEIRVRMHNRIQLRRPPHAFLLDLLNLQFMSMFKHPVTGNMEALLLPPGATPYR